MDEMVTCDRGHYAIECEIKIAEASIFLARDKKSKKPFMVGEKQQSTAYMKQYKRLAVTANYIAALEEWNRRIAEAIAQLKNDARLIRT